ncbi:MAG: HU family DNA-binding protein [SAR324 cluster bacterium]|nr:HU family DNA-binding protein [SAR324 cluster bacterium]
MTKAELIAAIAKDLNVTKASAERHLNSTLGVITKTLKKGESIPLVGFGTFSVAKRKARKGRHPQTGEVLKIPASKVVKFSTGKNLKEAVDKKRKK